MSLAAKGHPTVHKGGNTRTARTIRRETDDILPLAPTTMYHGKHNTRERRRKLSSLLTHTLPPSHPHTLSPHALKLTHSSQPTTPPSAQEPNIRGGTLPAPRSKEPAASAERAHKGDPSPSSRQRCQLGHRARGSRAAPPEPISPTTHSSRSGAAPCTSHGWPLACQQPAWHRRSTSSASR